jgi:thiol-disulfide isomerase/thioredoxin
MKRFADWSLSVVSFALLTAALGFARPALGDEPPAAEADKLKKAVIERLQGLFSGQEPDFPKLLEELHAYLKSGELDAERGQIALLCAQAMEMTGDPQGALKLLEQLKATFAKATDKELAETVATTLDAANKRLSVIGKPLALEGRLVDGQPFDWSKYKGKVVLVDFWATWCGPCVRELPTVRENYAKYHERGFEVVGISLDDDKDALTEFIKAKELPWENLFGAEALADKYGIQAIPMTYLVGRDGKVVAVHLRGEGLGQQLEKLLGKEGANDKPK